MNKKQLEIYIHIPFCVRKCLYCDFLSAPADEKTKAAYMNALFTEIKTCADEYRDYTVSSVFIGGGTPSAVKHKYIVELMKILHNEFSFEPDAEVTVEINPGTADTTALKAYYESGINRLSIGLQSANETELKALGRIHSYEDFMKAYKYAAEAGFTNINVDIMSDIPGQTCQSLSDTIEKIVNLSPAPRHISAYSLIVEEGTPFYEMWQQGRLDIPDEEQDRLMYAQTKLILEKYGYHRYEISNYAKEGYRCRHNCGYWKRVPYIGFGIGAASLIGNMRFSNDTDLYRYIAAPCGCRINETMLEQEDCMEEFMFLGLRLTEGVVYDEFEDTFGRSIESVYGNIIRKNIAEGLLYEYENVDTKKEESMGKRLALTDRGVDISNYVMSQFMF
jgi:oxygen-independent coproporphyrinogen-3 oxidase